MFCRWLKGFFKHFSKNSQASAMVRVLNVAEKNDAAKSLAEIMSRGRYTKVIMHVVIICSKFPLMSL
jgi:hypothetical protein